MIKSFCVSISDASYSANDTTLFLCNVKIMMPCKSKVKISLLQAMEAHRAAKG
jgi:hypothetical protein